MLKIYQNRIHQTPAIPALSKTSIFKWNWAAFVAFWDPMVPGKTTLLKILAGLLSPTSGEISILGMNPQETPHDVRKQIGWMPAEERSGFYGRLTGTENLEFFSALQNLPPKDFNRTLGNLALLLGIEKELDKRMLLASGGARQKLGLARVLLHDPGVLFLDEPFRNLDPHTVLRFRRLLKDHLTRNQGKTVILSTHQLDEAKRVADTVIILNEGKILKQLTALELSKELRNKSMEDYYLQLVEREVKA